MIIKGTINLNDVTGDGNADISDVTELAILTTLIAKAAEEGKPLPLIPAKIELDLTVLGIGDAATAESTLKVDKRLAGIDGVAPTEVSENNSPTD